MLPEKILKSLPAARSSELQNELLHHEDAEGANEFLFFIKPELLIEDSSIQTQALLEMIMEKISSFGFSISSVRILSAEYLKNHGIIAQHYGVINQIASDAKATVSANGKAKFEEIFSESFDDANVLGGLQMLEKYPMFNAESLDYIWQNTKFEKLAGGTYAQKLSFDGETVYQVNGFHARQLEHFTQQGRCIVVFSLKSETSWADARGKFIGATCPDDAETGSIRRELLDNIEKFGLKAVTPSWNGVHLSAGPIEGLVELIRYQSDFDGGNALTASDFTFGKQLVEAFGLEKTEWILSNPTVDHEGSAISLFDLTEEMNASHALELLKKVIDN